MAKPKAAGLMGLVIALSLLFSGAFIVIAVGAVIIGLIMLCRSSDD